MTVNNFTDKTFSSLDMALLNNYNKAFYPSVFQENSLSSTGIKAGDRVAGNLSFAVDNPKKSHWLVFYDRYTRKPVAKISIENAKKAIKQREKEKKNKKKRKKKV